MSKNRVRITIADSSYVILSEESEDYVRLISEEIDSKIREIKKASSDVSSLMAAILTSMDFCDMYKKSVKSMKTLEEKLITYLDTNEKLRSENSALRTQMSELEMKLSALNIKNGIKN